MLIGVKPEKNVARTYFRANCNRKQVEKKKIYKTGENISIYVTTMRETGKTWTKLENLTAADPFPPPPLTFCPTIASNWNENTPSYTLWLFQIANALFPPLFLFCT